MEKAKTGEEEGSVAVHRRCGQIGHTERRRYDSRAVGNLDGDHKGEIVNLRTTVRDSRTDMAEEACYKVHLV